MESQDSERTRTEARASRRKFSLKSAIGWLLLASAYVLALSFYKRTMLDHFAQSSVQVLKVRHPKVLSLFQASFYFFYDDQFVPGIQQSLAPVPDMPRIERITILSGNGGVIYDSKNGAEGKPAVPAPGAPAPGAPATGKAPPAAPTTSEVPGPAVLARLSATEPSVFFRGFSVQILMPAGQYGILYTFEGTEARNRMALALVGGLLVLALLRLLLSKSLVVSLYSAARGSWVRVWRLRPKFLFAIVLINLVTATIVFYSLSSLQTRDQTRRIEKDSILFAQFSTARVISDFTNFFYFYYLDRFLPEVRNTIASNENLVGLRIISRRTNAILFDSEQTASGPMPAQLTDSRKAEIPPEIEEQLRTRDLATRYIMRDGERLLSVVNTYRNENQEALFWVEYVFSFQSLARSLAAIRHQILLGLVPSMLLGLGIAVVFAQLLISPIRRLVAALRIVTTGEYNVQVDIQRSDEIGDLVAAFNSMTSELKQKKELRKFLSDATYRQVMNQMESSEGGKIAGARVSATILFSDIRDFVAHCESLEAEEVTAMLNEYFSEMVEVVYKHGGEVDKFIGDALLAVFYSTEESKVIRPADPLAGTTSHTTALQAIYCALEMRDRLSDFNERRRAAKKNVIEIGVGITHGEIISGPIGSKDRMDFTVIGDVVNLANRIEKISKKGRHTKIVFSHHVEEKVRGLLNYEEFANERIRGKQEEVRVFELVGVRDLAELIRNLGHDNVMVRRQSVELLGQSRNQEALDSVITALRDHDEAVRLNAVRAVAKLAQRDDPKAVDALFDSLKTESAQKLVATIVLAIGRVCTTERVLDLVPYLDVPDERIAANAIEAMGQARSPKAADLLLPKLMSRNNRIKANAAMAIFAAGRFEVIDTLKPMLMHSDPYMRSSAAFALGELTIIAEQEGLMKSWKERPQATKFFLAELQDCVPMLVALLRDPEPIVRRQSVIALGKIKDKSAVLPLIDMIEIQHDPKELIRDVVEALRSIGSHKIVREVIAKFT